eukprot:4246889-Pyramimonas_sp.AAC.1
MGEEPEYRTKKILLRLVGGGRNWMHLRAIWANNPHPLHDVLREHLDAPIPRALGEPLVLIVFTSKPPHPPLG